MEKASQGVGVIIVNILMRFACLEIGKKEPLFIETSNRKYNFRTLPKGKVLKRTSKNFKKPGKKRFLEKVKYISEKLGLMVLNYLIVKMGLLDYIINLFK
ncbi:MAG: hypothetical protein IPL74_05655 [Bacteroidetes bacterium]|nr:hypothetical protein [Bacteroidota bacterium]